MGEVLAERPVLVEQRHADGRIGIQHLLGGDDLDLVGVDVKPELGARYLLAGIVDALQHREVPVGSLKQVSGCRGHDAAFSWLWRRGNRSWNTGKISLRSLTLRIDSGAPSACRR